MCNRFRNALLYLPWRYDTYRHFLLVPATITISPRNCIIKARVLLIDEVLLSISSLLFLVMLLPLCFIKADVLHSSLLKLHFERQSRKTLYVMSFEPCWQTSGLESWASGNSCLARNSYLSQFDWDGRMENKLAGSLSIKEFDVCLLNCNWSQK